MGEQKWKKKRNGKIETEEEAEWINRSGRRNRMEKQELKKKWNGEIELEEETEWKNKS